MWIEILCFITPKLALGEKSKYKSTKNNWDKVVKEKDWNRISEDKKRIENNAGYFSIQTERYRTWSQALVVLLPK